MFFHKFAYTQKNYSNRKVIYVATFMLIIAYIHGEIFSMFRMGISETSEDQQTMKWEKNFNVVGPIE